MGTLMSFLMSLNQARLPTSWKRRCAISIATTLIWLFVQWRQIRIQIPYQTQPSVTLSNSSDTIRLFDHDEPVQICGITVMFGDYEKTVKEPMQPQVPSFPLFLITDQEHLLHPQNNNTAWTRVRVNSSLWQEDCDKQENIGARNNPCENPFIFNIAKFYKMQFYRVPQLQAAGCNVVMWFDATIQIKNEIFMGHMADRATRGQNFVVYVQDRATRRADGTIASEALRSKYGKYGGRQGPAFGPPQHVTEQYEHYLSSGFREGWFRNESWYNQFKGTELNDFKYGLYITCMVMFDLRRQDTKTFLDCWWRENILRSTQDQVSFPYCAWKLGIPIRALPDAEDPLGGAEDNANFHKLDHGM